jgi:hypothetical protein
MIDPNGSALDFLRDVAGAQARIAQIPLHYGSKILFDMAKAPGIKLHGLHTTLRGDRMVIEWDGDPNWVYEVDIHPVKREEIDWENSCLLRKEGK